VRGASERSVVSLEAARAISDDVKARGGVVGMCNGCFDLMHMGHVGLLREAKARCSTLFVVVNSDASVRAMKGAARPFVPQEARAMMVSLNKFVDYVVISEETTCLKAADAIRPQVYVTTTECSDKSPEAREVLHSGGQVIVIGMLPGYNTTKIATEIAGKKTEKS
jgi:rfaE bifunctional protein nucleotidyltransferase chain/domain